MSDQNNIPAREGDERKPLSEDTLMAYLNGKLSAAEQHEVELWLADEGMESDALEGLHNMKPDETMLSVNRLNHNLRKATTAKKRRRRQPVNGQFTWIAIVIILLLIVVAYLVIRKAM